MMKACRSCGSPFHAKWRNAGEVCADCGGNPESDSEDEAPAPAPRAPTVRVAPFPATASVIPCETREEAETTSETMNAHGADVLIARRPRWYVRGLPEDVRTADWCIVVLEANRAS